MAVGVLIWILLDLYFFFLFHNFFGPKELFSSFLFFSFLWHSWLYCPGTWNTLYFSPTHAHPALQSNRHCLLNYEVPSHSLTHSVTHINLLPRCPLCLLPCSPNAISLSKPDEKTYDHLNKHRHSMASLSVRLWGRISFMWCMCARLCVSTCLCSLCTDIITVGYCCTWGLHVRVKVCRGWGAEIEPSALAASLGQSKLGQALWYVT